MNRPIDQWDKQPGEPHRAFAAFQHYRDSGIDRTLRKTCRAVDGNWTTLTGWSSRYKWVQRAEAYDREDDREHALQQRKARREMLKRHARLAGAMQNKVVERLQALDATKLTPRDLATWLEIATKLERVSLGEPDRHAIEHSGPDGGPIEVEVGEADLLNELRLIERELRDRVGGDDAAR